MRSCKCFYKSKMPEITCNFASCIVRRVLILNFKHNIFNFIYLFIQIVYYTHMGQAITIQKHANI
jgi:hypothetical protein